MLSLMSSSTPRLTGTRSRVNCVIGLRIAVVEHLEVVARQAGDELAVGVADGDRDAGDVDARLEGVGIPDLAAAAPGSASATTGSATSRSALRTCMGGRRYRPS